MRIADPAPLEQHPDVTTRIVRTSDDAEDALALLDAAEEAAGVPLVDESERERLGAAASAHQQEHHHAVVAHAAAGCVGYAGVLVPPPDEHGVGDVAVAVGCVDTQPVLRSLLHALDHVAQDHAAHGLQVWKRQASTDDVASAIAAGYAVHRRLYVLGRSLDGGWVDDEPLSRAMQPGDVDDIVDVLAAAYEGTDDGGWTRERFEERTALPWFDPDDLRVVEVDGRVRGVHWTKRRGGGVGEVYNLAVHPEAQGRRLGRDLLQDGLRHLAEVGCREVLLWVDPDNESALRLYVAHGFRAKWEDVAFRRHTAETSRHAH